MWNYLGQVDFLLGRIYTTWMPHHAFLQLKEIDWLGPNKAMNANYPWMRYPLSCQLWGNAWRVGEQKGFSGLSGRSQSARKKKAQKLRGQSRILNIWWTNEECRRRQTQFTFGPSFRPFSSPLLKTLQTQAIWTELPFSWLQGRTLLPSQLAIHMPLSCKEADKNYKWKHKPFYLESNSRV